VITTVSNSDALWAAVKAAQAGDTIVLTAGNYSYLSLANMNPSGMVTITSQDPSHPAVISGISVMGSSNLTFTNIEVTPKVAGGYAVTLGNDTNVHLEGLNIHASATADGNAVLIQNSTHISVNGSDIHNIGTGISYVNSDFVQLTNNKIHGIQSDGMHGGGTSDITISGNTFTDFAPKAGDHPDAIQFWTSGTTTSAHDIVITNNVMTRGAGQIFQGVFMGADDKLPFQNVTITGNAIVGGMYNGINLQNGNHVLIENNLVQGYTDMNSWIALSKTTNSTVDGNTASTVTINANNIGVSVHDNAIVALQTVGDLTALATWQHVSLPIAEPAAPTFDFSDFSMWGFSGFGMF